MKITVTKDESQLLAVYRAIEDFDHKHLVGLAQVGDVLAALLSVIDLDELEKGEHGKALPTLIYGFVAGIASVVQSEVPQYTYEPLEEIEEADYTVAGGPTGGVVAGQGNDPRYVAQTGPRDDQEVE